MFLGFWTLYSFRPQICLELGAHAQYIHGILYPTIYILGCVCWGGEEGYFAGLVSGHDTVNEMGSQITTERFTMKSF